MENRFDARDRLNALSTGMKIALPAAILLLIDMFLPWQDFGNEFTEAVGVDVSLSGWEGFWGILLGLVTLALIVWLALQAAGVDLSGVNLPVTHAMITLGLGVLLLAVAVIKLLTIIDDESTIWAYIGVLLAAVAAYGAYQRSREMDEVAPVGTTGLGGPDTTSTTTAGGTTGGSATGLGSPDTTPPSTGATGTGLRDDDVAPSPAAPPTAPPTATEPTTGDVTGAPPRDLPEERPGGTGTTTSPRDDT